MRVCRQVELLKCSSCKYVYYCGKLCQKNGWSVHKQECQKLKCVAPRILPDAARMLYRLLKRLQNGGATVKGYYTEKQYRVWRDLMSRRWCFCLQFSATYKKTL